MHKNSITKNISIFFSSWIDRKNYDLSSYTWTLSNPWNVSTKHWSTESVSDSNFEEDDARGIERRKGGERRSLSGKREDRWRKIYTCLHDVRHDRIAMFEIQLKEVGGREKKREERVESDRAGSALRPPRPFQPRGFSNKMNQLNNCYYYYYFYYFAFRVLKKKKKELRTEKDNNI